MEEPRHVVAARFTYTALVENQTAVLLDTHSGLFLGLNSSATAMWKLLTQEGKTLQEASREVARISRVPVEAVSRDLDAFVTTMLERHLLYEGIAASPPPIPLLIQHWSDRQALPSFLERVEATLTLRRIHALLSRRGLAHACRYVAALPAYKLATATHHDVVRLSHVVKQTARWHSCYARCLHHSFTLAVMLRRWHILADIVIGVYKYPFTAHAWVESNGHIIQWEAGLGAYPDDAFLQALTVIFRSSEVQA